MTFDNSATSTTTLNAAASGGFSIIIADQTAPTTFNAGTGNDYLIGNTGNDTFAFGVNLTSADNINGGAGTDTLTFTDSGAATSDLNGVTNVESITLGAATTNVTTVDALVTAGQTLTVNSSLLSSAQSLTWNGAAETDGAFVVTGGAGNDSIIGGAGNDTITSGGGNDTLAGGNGNDTLVLGANLTSADTINGGAGTDTLTFTDSGAAVTDLNGGTSIESITLGAAITSVTTVDALVSAGQRLTVNGSALGAGQSLTWTGSSETDGAFTITGGAAGDLIVGGAGDDILVGKGGNDTVTGGSGNDHFVLRTDGGSDVVNDYVDTADKIGFLDNDAGGISFANTGGTGSGTTLADADFISVAGLANLANGDDNKVALFTSAVADASALGNNSGLQNVAIILFNSATGLGEIWYDGNWANSGGRVKIATLNGVTTLAGVTAISNADIVVYDTTVTPAGVAGQPINLGLADRVPDHFGVVTVLMAGVPDGWTLSEGTDNGNGTWTVQTTDPAALTVTTDAGFRGALVLPMTVLWTNPDGTSRFSDDIDNNVEAYGPGSPDLRGLRR